MSQMKDRMEQQRAAERELVARQMGEGPEAAAPSIEGSGSAAPRVAQREARAADKAVRHELAEDLREGLKKLVGKR